MNLRPRLLIASLVLGAAGVLPTADARACGGCFHESTQTQSTVVTGHRMAFAISTTHSVLWDQIKYSGSPGEFAWVLPVRGGAEVQLSHDAWFEALEAATSAQIVSPPINCPGASPSGSPGCGCGSASSAASFGGTKGVHDGTEPPPVTVTHEGTVGPYETVTLHANVPNALPSWLKAHNYAIDPSVTPIIDAYTAEGFDFIALRLLPGQGVQQMKPVRVVTQGMSPSLPLRMVAAGTGANVAITLFVIGEGRWEAQNFPNAEVDPSTLTWDFATQSSDYSTKRQALLASAGGRTWNNAFSNQGSLLSQDLLNGFPTSITVGSSSVSTLAEAYVQQGVNDGEPLIGDTSQCSANFSSYASSLDKVVDCSSGTTGVDGGLDPDASSDGGSDGGSSGPPCSGLAIGEIPSSSFACGPLDDIAVALVGLHPQSVWLTRLEANLPRAALATDLTLQASKTQTPISNVLNLTKSKGDPCGAQSPVDAGAGVMSDAHATWLRNQLAVYATVVAAVAAALGRRRRHAPVIVGHRAR